MEKRKKGRGRSSPALVLLALTLLGGTAIAQELKQIALPAPQTHGGKPLMEVLSLRATDRAFAADELSAQTLSNPLWAAWGINRPKGALRTAPSAMDWQEIDVYVVMSSGAYIYDALTITLKPVAAGDYRALTGVQDFVKDAPVSLVYVADAARMKVNISDTTMKAAMALKESCKWADSAVISENAYLYAASEGLATGVRALIHRPALSRLLKLNPEQSITLAQCVGFPKK
jgi:nitroreductase